MIKKSRGHKGDKRASQSTSVTIACTVIAHPVTWFKLAKSSQISRQKNRGLKHQFGEIALEMLGWIAFAITLLVLLLGVPQ